MNRDEFMRLYDNDIVKLTEDEQRDITVVSAFRCDKNTKCTVFMEELAELTVELSKWIRGEGSKVDILEEMADVQICLNQMKLIFGYEQEAIDRAIEVKLWREEGRCKTHDSDRKD